MTSGMEISDKRKVTTCIQVNVCQLRQACENVHLKWVNWTLTGVKTQQMKKNSPDAFLKIMSFAANACSVYLPMLLSVYCIFICPLALLFIYFAYSNLFSWWEVQRQIISCNNKLLVIIFYVTFIYLFIFSQRRLKALCTIRNIYKYWCRYIDTSK